MAARTGVAGANPQITLAGQDQTAATLSPEAYVKAIADFFKLPSGIGQGVAPLHTFLASAQRPSSQDNFLTIYDLPSSADNDSQHLEGHHFRSLQEFEDFHAASKNRKKGQLVFLKGYPSQAWIKALGAKYQLDPEFFNRHLDFHDFEDPPHRFSIPALHSSCWNIMRLTYMTIASRDGVDRGNRALEIDKLRQSAEESMKKYIADLIAGLGFETGSSIVRRCSILDEKHFVLEQRVTICVQTNQGRWSAFVWNDCGTNMYDGHAGPWSTSQDGTRTFLYPIMKQRPNIGLKAHHLVGSSRTTPGLSGRPPQTSSHIHLDYARTLRTTLLGEDAAYALNEVFGFIASAQNQFLNLMQAKLDAYEQSDRPQDLRILRSLKQILIRNAGQLREITHGLHDANLRKWPRRKDGAEKTQSPEKTHQSAERIQSANEAIKVEFDSLLETASSLHAQCNEAITVLMSSLSIASSEKQMLEAERVGKLTFMAFIFVPLSFTTSFFGMNFKELGDSMSIYTWFVFTLPLVAAALVAYLVDPAKVRQWLGKCIKRITPRWKLSKRSRKQALQR